MTGLDGEKLTPAEIEEIESRLKVGNSIGILIVAQELHLLSVHYI